VTRINQIKNGGIWIVKFSKFELGSFLSCTLTGIFCKLIDRLIRTHSGRARTLWSHQMISWVLIPPHQFRARRRLWGSGECQSASLGLCLYAFYSHIPWSLKLLEFWIWTHQTFQVLSIRKPWRWAAWACQEEAWVEELFADRLALVE